ncbi:MAG: SHOCT domain-containing protein [Flavobacteriaceae bacterium]|jgi:hypothetical protein|nr:SHOCT domain-containing protein [Flavobacteriaceae bacterium]
MENIIVGLIVGATLTSSVYIWNNESFSKSQKIVLLLFLVFPPLQWLGILLVLWYNKYEKENTSEFKEEKKLSTSIDDLKDLKQKGILTDEEFSAKIKKVEQDSLEHKLKNSTEYKQLKNLLDSGILADEEFSNKIEVLRNNLNVIDSNTEKTREENKKSIKLQDGKVLEILNSYKSYKFDSSVFNDIGLSVKVDGEIPNDCEVLSGDLKLKYLIKQGVIKKMFLNKFYQTKIGEIIIEQQDYFVPTSGDNVYKDGKPLEDGKYRLSFMNYINVRDGRVV